MSNNYRCLYNYVYTEDISIGYNKNFNSEAYTMCITHLKNYYKKPQNNQITKGWWAGINHCFNLEDFNSKVNFLYTSDITTGFSITMFENIKHKLTEGTEKWIISSTIDMLIRLSSYQALISICGHDHMTDEFKNFNINNNYLNELLLKLQNTTKFDLSSPQNFGGNNFGIIINNKLFNWIHLSTIYPLLFITKFIETNKLNITNICEIGGGLGYLCYYFIKNTDYNYTLIDLTNANVSQHILLFNEFSSNVFNERIKLVNPLLEDVNEIKCDILINQDSFAEMSEEILVSYLDKIGNNTYIFSFNQESKHNGLNISVHETINKHPELNIKLLSRSLSFYRSGYTDEIYFKTTEK